MIIVIDGYNLLKQIYTNAYISMRQRESFIHMLQQYAKIKKHAILVVFDGGDSTWPTVEKRDYVTIAYSGTHESADTYIKSWIANNHHKDILIASNDRDICLYADEYTVVSIDVIEFYRILKQSLQGDKRTKNSVTVINKTAENTQEDLDAVMHEYSNKIVSKDEDVPGDMATERGGSKKEKQLLKKLKKL